mmetsp:Transcript_47375/g.157922  ORF Transcript_47375/g.157922 Transcript_47375/m.157922 type:complete len:249 (-) Transcript_47375:54-800(-)
MALVSPSDADAAAAAPSDAMQPMRPMPRYGKSSGPLALPPPASAPSPDSASAGGGLLGVPAHAKRWYASRGGLLTTGGGGDSGGSSKGGGSIFDRLLGAPAKPDPFYVRYCPALSWEDRVLGFLACLVIGYALTITSLFSYTALIHGNPAPFALRYSLGNLLAICSTAFLMGPQAQIKSMLEPQRFYATTVYLGAIVATLVSALVLRMPSLVVCCICVQFLAMLWYGLSFIPYGRKILGRMASWLFGL